MLNAWTLCAVDQSSFKPLQSPCFVLEHGYTLPLLARQIYAALLITLSSHRTAPPARPPS